MLNGGALSPLCQSLGLFLRTLSVHRLKTSIITKTTDWFCGRNSWWIVNMTLTYDLVFRGLLLHKMPLQKQLHLHNDLTKQQSTNSWLLLRLYSSQCRQHDATMTGRRLILTNLELLDRTLYMNQKLPFYIIRVWG